MNVIENNCELKNLKVHLVQNKIQKIMDWLKIKSRLHKCSIVKRVGTHFPVSPVLVFRYCMQKFPDKVRQMTWPYVDKIW